MKKMFLHDLHQNAGANFIEIQNCQIPADYGNVVGELSIINKNIALLDRSYLGKISMCGNDGLDLLNRVSTNDLQYLAVGTVVDTIFVTPKGRLIDYCRLINTGEDYILIGSFFKANHLIDWINRFIILEDAYVSDVSDIYLWLTLLGPHAKTFIGHFTEKPISDQDDTVWLTIDSVIFPAIKNNNFRVPAYNFFLGTQNAQKVINQIHSYLKECGGNFIGDSAFQILRVESGMPDWGTEITQDYNPHEARLTHAISFTKGCYTGQEVIARLDTYDKVQKYLMIIELQKKISADPPLELFIDDESIGHLTSYVYDPVSKRSVGLGYVRKMYALANNIYVEVQVDKKRIPANLRLPPQAYLDK
jgi:folate-binding protein YgfZ